MKIVMLDRTGADFSLEKKAFHARGAAFLVTYFKDAGELRSIVHDADVLLFNDAHITKEVIDALEKCKLIVGYGMACDTVDLEAAGKKGIFVCNTPSHGIYDAAEHTMALLLAAARQIPLADSCARSGKWGAEYACNVRRLRGKTLGLVGYDDVARLVAARARAFEMEVLVTAPFGNEDENGGAFLADFPALLERADYVSLHAPAREETRHMMGMAQFKYMKKDAVLLNTAHGSLVNENELIFALLSGEIGGAALDALEKEPPSASCKLLSLPNVIMTPRLAYYSCEGTDDLHKEVTENVLRFLSGDAPLHIINEKFLKARRF